MQEAVIHLLQRTLTLERHVSTLDSGKAAVAASALALQNRAAFAEVCPCLGCYCDAAAR